MRPSLGWIRLWIVAAVLLGIVAFIQAFQYPNVFDADGSGWNCLPGTRSDRPVSLPDGHTEPTAEQVQREVERLRPLRISNDQGILEITAAMNLREPRFRSVTLYTCSSYGLLIWNLIAALAAALVIAVGFFVARWIVIGFRSAG